jgi:DNA mismatch endonuclease (patch repair protein)
MERMDAGPMASLSADNLTPEQRQRTMRRVRSVDTGPEMTVRRLAHGLGYRYRLHRKDLPGKPDLVFPARRKVIFVHGCFWHGHDCKAGRKQPKTNADYWTVKLGRNRARDLANQALLREHGWDVLVIWECRIRDRDALRADICRFLGPKERRA